MRISSCLTAHPYKQARETWCRCPLADHFAVITYQRLTTKMTGFTKQWFNIFLSVLSKGREHANMKLSGDWKCVGRLNQNSKWSISGLGNKKQTNRPTTTKTTLDAVLQGKVPPERDLPLDTSPVILRCLYLPGNWRDPKSDWLRVASHKWMSRWKSYPYARVNSFSNIEKALEAAVDHKRSVRYQCQTAMVKANALLVLAWMEIELKGQAGPWQGLRRGPVPIRPWHFRRAVDQLEIIHREKQK